MQLAFAIDDRTERLRDIHRRLIARFGRRLRPRGSRFSPLDQLVQGVIGAQTRTEVSNRSTREMLAHYGDWANAAAAPTHELQRFLETATFPERMAERLKSALTAIVDRCGGATLDHLHTMSVTEAMAWLEDLPGVGRKVSASVMNASTMNRPAMVIDSHHRRIVQRLGLVPPRADTARAYDILVPLLPTEWSPEDMDEHHMLMKALGQTICRPTAPDCRACPVVAQCETGRALAG
ncbi:MAG: endonuclease III [Pseudomonadota bacterium]